MKASQADRIASSLSTVLLLCTYGLLTYEHWSRLIPLYMDAIGNLNTNAEEQKGLEKFQSQLQLTTYLIIKSIISPFTQMKRFQRRYSVSFQKMNYQLFRLTQIRLGHLQHSSVSIEYASGFPSLSMNYPRFWGHLMSIDYGPQFMVCTI